MLLSSAPCPPAGDRWVHEPNLDGWRCIAQVQDGKVRLWAREGLEWSPLLPELSCLADLGDLVLDGELVALSPDGRADFDLLSTRMTGTATDLSVCLYAFDILRLGEHELVQTTWADRREALDALDVGGRTAGQVRTTIWTTDGSAMHRASAEVEAEGTVPKRLRPTGPAAPVTG